MNDRIDYHTAIMRYADEIKMLSDARSLFNIWAAQNQNFATPLTVKSFNNHIDERIKGLAISIKNNVIASDDLPQPDLLKESDEMPF